VRNEGKADSKSDREALQERARLGDQFRNSSVKQGLGDKTPDQVVADAKAGEAAAKVLKDSGLAPSLGSFSELPTLVGTLASDNKRLKGQMTNLQHRCGSGGTQMPPCWVTANGEAEYIFDVDLVSGGEDGQILLHDDHVTSHDDDKARLFQSVTFDRPLTESQFLDQTGALYAFGRQQKPECRFFVRVQDRTEAHDKEVFKDLLLTVEEHFYKKLLSETDD